MYAAVQDVEKGNRHAKWVVISTSKSGYVLVQWQPLLEVSLIINIQRLRTLTLAAAPALATAMLIPKSAFAPRRPLSSVPLSSHRNLSISAY